MTSTKLEVPDGGYGWVVVFASMMCNVIVDGILYGYSVMKIPLSQYFNVGEGLILLPGSMAVGIYMLCGPIYAKLSSKYGCRPVVMIGSFISFASMIVSITSSNVYTLLITYGICAGFGLGLIYLPSIVVLSYYFDKKLTMATGIVVSGTGIGVLSFGHVVGILFDYYGWKGGMMIIAAIVLNCSIFGALMKMPAQKESDKNSKHELEEADKQKVDKITNVNNRWSKLANSIIRFDLLCDPTVAIISLANVFGFFGYLIVMMMLVTVTEKQFGASPVQARFTMTTLGIANTIGRFVFGWIPGPKTCTIGTINYLSLLICSISCFLFPWLSTYIHILIFSIVFGAFTAPYVGLTPAVVYDAVGKNLYNDVLGITFFFRGFSCMIGPSLGGYIADATGSYMMPFIISAVALLLCTVLHFVLPWTYNIKCGIVHSRVSN